jgi:hypothetical protein
MPNHCLKPNVIDVGISACYQDLYFIYKPGKLFLPFQPTQVTHLSHSNCRTWTFELQDIWHVPSWLQPSRPVPYSIWVCNSWLSHLMTSNAEPSNTLSIRFLTYRNCTCLASSYTEYTIIDLSDVARGRVNRGRQVCVPTCQHLRHNHNYLFKYMQTLSCSSSKKASSSYFRWCNWWLCAGWCIQWRVDYGSMLLGPWRDWWLLEVLETSCLIAMRCLLIIVPIANCFRLHEVMCSCWQGHCLMYIVMCHTCCLNNVKYGLYGLCTIIHTVEYETGHEH